MSYEIQEAAMRAAGYCEKAIEEWRKDPAHGSVEDSIGPSWSEPWGCCFGECDTPFSQAFREYHGLEQAWQDYRAYLTAEAKRRWKSTRRKPGVKDVGGKTLEELLNREVKNPYDLPLYLRKRLLYWNRRIRKLSRQ